MNPIRRLPLLCLVLILVFPILFQNKAYAAIPKLDRIRVALYIDNGKYNVTSPQVTITADKGFELSLAGPGGGKPIASETAGIKAMADQAQVVLLETADAAAAQALYRQLDASDKPGGVVRRQKAGEPTYQVYAGPYATKEAAGAAKDALLKQPGIAQAVNSFAPYVAGPLHWNAGVYATEAEAAAQAAAIAQAGFPADVAYMNSGSGLSYVAMVGSEKDAESLNALKASIGRALPAVVLLPVEPSASYVIKRPEAAPDSTGAASQYVLGGGAKVTIVPNQPGIKIAEKAGRAYRGTMELSVSSGKLAVVNELPLEEYVYSVVGSELGASWPAEALKAQAVAARTFALKAGNKYGIAHVSDSTADQVYKGMGSEAAAITEAVNATKGEVIVDRDGLITPFFFSNAGGMTADPVEVWGKPIAYLKSVPSPDDGPETKKTTWYRIKLPGGAIGYIHSDYARATGQKNEEGLPYYESTGSSVNVRSGPGTDTASLLKVNVGDKFVVLDNSAESNAFSWTRGPYTADELLGKMNAALSAPITGKLERLEVAARGPSGRVTEVKANGQTLKVASPDSLRAVFGGLPSTRFEIVTTGGGSDSGARFEIGPAGSYTIWGADGAVSTIAADKPVYVLSGGRQAEEVSAGQLSVLTGTTQTASAAAAPSGKDGQFMFKGTGSGHGLGMSQWGARGYALLGYDYRKILQTYYDGVQIVKE